MPFASVSGHDSYFIEGPHISFKTLFKCNLQRIGHLVILKAKVEEMAVIDLFFFLTNTATWHKSFKCTGPDLGNPSALLVESQLKICAHSCISRSQLWSSGCLLPPCSTMGPINSHKTQPKHCGYWTHLFPACQKLRAGLRAEDNTDT